MSADPSKKFISTLFAGSNLESVQIFSSSVGDILKSLVNFTSTIKHPIDPDNILVKQVPKILIITSLLLMLNDFVQVDSKYFFLLLSRGVELKIIARNF